MRSLRLAGLTLKSMLTDTPILRAAVVAIILVPLLYGALYLWAFWDPYSKLNQMPVAVVNLDHSVVVKGIKIDGGHDLVKALKDGNDVGWKFVSAEEAAKGLKERRYYLSLTIPADYSAKLGTAQTDNPVRAELKVVAQESSNMLASQIMQRVFSEVRAGAAAGASRGYIDNMYLGFSDAHDGLTDAALGAKDLKDGLQTARDGAKKLAAGTDTADDGAHTLASGLSTLASGAGDANSGAHKLAAGTRTLAVGLLDARVGATALDAGASKLATGLASANAGAKGVAGGSAALRSGLTTAKGGASHVAGGLGQLSTGAAQLDGALGQLSTGADTLSGSAGELKDGAAQLKSGVDDALSKVGEAKDGAKQVRDGASGVSAALHAYLDAHPEAASDSTFQQALGGADAVKDGSKQLYDGLASAAGDAPTLAGGADQVADGASKLSAGAKLLAGGASQAHAASTQLAGAADQLATGATQLSTGITSAENGAMALAAGSAQLASGTSALTVGASSLKAGTSKLAAGTVSAWAGASKLAVGSATLVVGTNQLASGAVSAATGARTLATGVGQLNEGAHTLSSGLPSAVSGAEDLRSGLSSGAVAVPDYTTALRNSNDDMMSNPVELTTQRHGEVPTYGTGFTPYFIPLALWVGALLTFFIVKPLHGRALASGANPLIVALASYLPGAAFGILQAIILMAVVQFGLGLKPVNVLATYAFTILAALVFTAILQMLNGAFGAVGKLISIVVLMLQLTSAGGTFPTQMIPGFFQAINPFLPMSYVVIGMRQTISGGDLSGPQLSASSC
jgi:putative membrane protein